MSRIRGGIAVLVLIAAVALGLGYGARARGDEGPSGETSESVSGAGNPSETLQRALESPPGLAAMARAREEASGSQSPGATTGVSPQNLRDLSAAEAASTAAKVFPEIIEEPASTLPSLSPRERIVGLPAENVAQISLGGEGHAVLESSRPIFTTTAAGKTVPVDLSLDEKEGEIEPVHPLVPVEIPLQLSEGISLPESGVTITPVNSSGAPLSSSGKVDGATAFYANTEADSDTLVKPLPEGFETQTLLRSADSPETLRFKVAAPGDPKLTKLEDGSVAIEAGEATIATVAPVTATDANGTPVPATMEVDGPELVVKVEGDPAEYQLPIAVDPVVTEHNWGYFEQGPWYFTTNDPSSFNSPFTAGHPEFPTVYTEVPYTYGQYGAWNYTTQGQSRIYQYEPSVWSGYSEDQMQNIVGIIGAGGWEAQQWLGNYVYPQLTTVQCPAGNCTEGGGTADNTAVYEKIATNSGSFTYGEAQNYAVRIAQSTGPSVAFDTTHETVEGHLNALFPGRWLHNASEGMIAGTATDPGIGIYKRGISSPTDKNWYGLYYGAAPGCVGVQCDETLPLSVSAGGLPEGESTVEARVENATGAVGTKTATVKIDGAAPTVSLSGLKSGHLAGLGNEELRGRSGLGEGLDRRRTDRVGRWWMLARTLSCHSRSCLRGPRPRPRRTRRQGGSEGQRRECRHQGIPGRGGRRKRSDGQPRTRPAQPGQRRLPADPAGRIPRGRRSGPLGDADL